MNDEGRGWAQAARLAELGVLTSSLLHELRQPLFALKSMIELDLAGGADGRLRAMLGQVEQIERLVQHYGGLGRDDELPQPYDPVSTVVGAVEMLRFRARQVGAALEVEQEALPTQVGQPGALRQIVLNLVHNALDAVDGHAERRVVLRVAPDGGTLLLVVADSGPGFAPEVAARAFQPFVTTKPPGRGTGLGLYITRALVEEAGGTVRLGVASPGARVEVRLPLRDSGG